MEQKHPPSPSPFLSLKQVCFIPSCFYFLALFFVVVLSGCLLLLVAGGGGVEANQGGRTEKRLPPFPSLLPSSRLVGHLWFSDLFVFSFPKFSSGRCAQKACEPR